MILGVKGAVPETPRATLDAFVSGNVTVGRTLCLPSPGSTPGRKSFSLLNEVAGILPAFCPRLPAEEQGQLERKSMQRSDYLSSWKGPGCEMFAACSLGPALPPVAGPQAHGARAVREAKLLLGPWCESLEQSLWTWLP